MLYEYNALKNLDSRARNVALERYLYKYENLRKEIRKLKPHEKHFLFKKMSILRQGNEYAFDLSTIEQASDYYFNVLIFIYFENLSFYKKTKDHLDQIISCDKMRADKAFFDIHYQRWKYEVETKKGKYLGILHTELHRHLKMLKDKYERRLFKEKEYLYRTKEIYAMSFCIYYKVKYFFDGQRDKFVHLNLYGVDVVINIYSFIHILFRHYYPALDDRSRTRDMNTPLPFLNIDELPISLKEFLTTYSEHVPSPIDYSTEYILFSFNQRKYIIWLKYNLFKELGNIPNLELRSLYKCSEQRDIDRFDGLTGYPVDANLSFYC